MYSTGEITMGKDLFDQIVKKTDCIIYGWENQHMGYAPTIASQKLSHFNFGRMPEMTRELGVLFDEANYDIAEDMTEARRVIAYIVLGGLIEGWLRLFFCIYASDYNENMFSKVDKKGDIFFVKLDKLKFSDMISYISNNIWDKPTDVGLINWLGKIRKYRNTAHIYNMDKVGDSAEFVRDVIVYLDFFNKIIGYFPELPSNIVV